MILIKKMVAIYQYIYYRLYLFHTKQWGGNKRLGLFNSNFAISFSAIALVYSIDLIFRRNFGIDGLFNNNYAIMGLVIVVFVVHTLIFSINEESLKEKYPEENESDLSWKIKGYASLFFVFGPIILLIILM